MQAEVASERRPRPAGDIQEREIGGKNFKLGTSLCQELQDKIRKVVTKHMIRLVIHKHAWDRPRFLLS